MSTNHILRHPDDETWLQRVNAALEAVQALHQTVSQQNNHSSLLTRQLLCLKRARAAWLAGDRAGAHQLLTAALNPGDEATGHAAG